MIISLIDGGEEVFMDGVTRSTNSFSILRQLAAQQQASKKLAIAPGSPTRSSSPTIGAARQIEANMLEGSKIVTQTKHVASNVFPPNSVDKKIEELHLTPIQFPEPRKRDCYPFDTNITMARATSRELTGGRGLESVSFRDPTDGKVVRSAIADDAQRRLAIFYYQCLAYWNSGAKVDIGDTLHQHGVALSPGCTAAHSAICPNLKDDYFDQLAQKVITNNADAEIHARLLSLGANQGDIIRISAASTVAEAKTVILSALKLSEGDSLLSLQHHLYHSANATIECKGFLNAYHQKIEDQLRPVAIGLINDCSTGIKRPHDCAVEFARQLQSVLNLGLKENHEKWELTDKLIQKIHEFSALGKTWLSVAKQCSPVSGCLKSLGEIRDLLHKIKALQHYSLKVNLGAIWKQFQGVIDLQPPLILSGNRLRSSSTSALSKLSKDHGKLDAYFRAFTQPIDLSALVEGKTLLEECGVFIYDLQLHSQCPEEKMLSGRLQGNVRAEPTDDDLKQEQNRITSPHYNRVVHHPARPLPLSLPTSFWPTGGTQGA